MARDDDSKSLPLPTLLTFGAAGGWDVGISRSELFDDMFDGCSVKIIYRGEVRG